jgi:hypothetical protein
MAAEIDIFANLDTKDAQKQVKKFARTTEKSLKSLESSFGSLKTLAVAAVGAFAGKQLLDGLSAVTQAASVQEDAVNSLNTALKLSGDFSEETSQSMQQFASDLQNVTTIGDETTLEMLALSKAMGRTNEESQDLVKAAADLSAITGQSLESAVTQLNKSYSGLAGELGESIPGIRDLTAEQLKLGGAIKIVAESFGGAAQAEVNTFSGAIKQLENTTGDLAEELGFLITKNPAVIESIKELSNIFNNLIEFVKDNNTELGNFVSEAFGALLKSVPLAVQTLNELIKVFRNIAIVGGSTAEIILFVNQSVLELLNIPKVINAIGQSLKELLNAAAGVVKQIDKVPGALNILANQAGPLGGILIDLAGGSDTLSKAFDGLAEAVPTDLGSKLAETNEEALHSVREFNDQTKLLFKQITENADEFTEDYLVAIEKILRAEGPKVTTQVEIQGPKKGDRVELEPEIVGPPVPERLKQEIEPSFEDLQLEFSNAIKDGIETFTDEFPEESRAVADAIATPLANATKKATEEGFTGAFAGIATMLGQTVLSGAEGAGNFFAQTLGSITDAFFPGVGAAVTGIASQLIALGPEGVKQQVEAFVNELPTIINTLAEAGPALVVAVAENADKIILALIKGIPNIIGALIQAMPEVAVALAISVVELLNQAFEGLGFNIEKFTGFITKAGDDFGREVSEGFKTAIAKFQAGFDNITSGLRTLADFFRGMFQPLLDITDGFNRLLDRLSGGGSPIGKKGEGGFEKAIGVDIPGVKLQKGGIGRVPGTGQRDTFPAALTPGELVIDRDTTGLLQDFLANQEGGGGNEEMVSILIQILTALQQPKSVQTSVEFDGRTLADIMLQLDRTNARTVA